MTHLSLLQSVEQARAAFIQECQGLSPTQSTFKVSADAWSITEITEHIVRAEWIGVFGMWKALDGYRHGQTIWEGKPIHKGLDIERIIERTWAQKEKVPEIARPIWGGSIDYWLASLEACRHSLALLGQALKGKNLEAIIYPHPISGPLDVRQRLQFLAFHLKRHQMQIQRVKAHADFPVN